MPDEIPPTSQNQIETSPDWTIGSLYKRAFAIVKQNKLLWIFGLAAAGSGLSNFSGSSHLDTRDLEFVQNIFQNTSSHSSQTSHVLGASTNIVVETIPRLFSGISVAWYIILGIEIACIIVISIIISIIYNGWSQAALLEGIEKSINKMPLTITELSEKAFTCLRSIIFIQLIPLLLLICLGLLIFFFLVFSINWFVIIMFIFIIVCLAIILNVAIPWAIRAIVVEKKPAMPAVQKGIMLAKRKFWASIFLGIVNTTVGIVPGIITLVALFVVGIPLVFGGFFGFSVIKINAFLGISILSLCILIFLLCINVFGIIGGIFTAFKTTVWSLAYHAIKDKYETK